MLPESIIRVDCRNRIRHNLGFYLHSFEMSNHLFAELHFHRVLKRLCELGNKRVLHFELESLPLFFFFLLLVDRKHLFGHLLDLSLLLFVGFHGLELAEHSDEAWLLILK